MHQSEVLRHFWTSKFVIDGNNYDFSQGDSCIRTNSSWLGGLREHSVHLASTFDRLLLVINDENLLLKEIHTLPLLQTIATLDDQSLIVRVASDLWPVVFNSRLVFRWSNRRFEKWWLIVFERWRSKWQQRTSKPGRSSCRLLSNIYRTEIQCDKLRHKLSSRLRQRLKERQRICWTERRLGQSWFNSRARVFPFTQGEFLMERVKKVSFALVAALIKSGEKDKISVFL